MPRTPVSINPKSGQRLKMLLSENDMTQVELAEKLGIHPQHISNVIRGKRRLTPDLAQQIKDSVFPDVLTDWLLGTCDIQTETERDIARKMEMEENRPVDDFYDKMFRCFLKGIVDADGHRLLLNDSDAKVGDFVTVVDCRSSRIGVVPVSSYRQMRRELEHYASYLIGLCIKEEMLPLAVPEVQAMNNG